jgi:histone deacetylase 11
MKAKLQKKRRRWPWVLLGIVALIGIYGCVTLVPPESFRAVKQPRSGRAMDRVALVYSKHYQINMAGFERLHSFDIHKYAKIYLQLNTDGFIRPEDVFVPEAVTREQILRVHTPAFLESLNDSAKVARYLEVPLVSAAPAGLVDAAMLNAFRYATGGTVLAGRLALEHGIAINLAGGYHHATPEAGAGFCVYADMPIAIRELQSAGLVKRVLVVDLDVHQGNGTAVCLGGDSSIFTFDMHEGDIYPIPKEKCSLDVELAADTTDDEYLAILAKHLPAVIEQAKPGIVLLQAGCDVLAGDPLARLQLTEQGIVARDAMVIDACVKHKIPVAMVLGGGYSGQAWHAQYLSVRNIIQKYGLAGGGPPHQPRSPTVKEKMYTK